MSGGTYSLKSSPNDRFLRNFSWQFFFTLRLFARNLLWGSRQRNIFISFNFDFSPRIWTRLISRGTTYCICKYSTNHPDHRCSRHQDVSFSFGMVLAVFLVDEEIFLTPHFYSIYRNHLRVIQDQYASLGHCKCNEPLQLR